MPYGEGNAVGWRRTPLARRSSGFSICPQCIPLRAARSWRPREKRGSAGRLKRYMTAASRPTGAAARAARGRAPRRSAADGDAFSGPDLARGDRSRPARDRRRPLPGQARHRRRGGRGGRRLHRRPRPAGGGGAPPRRGAVRAWSAVADGAARQRSLARHVHRRRSWAATCSRSGAGSTPSAPGGAGSEKKVAPPGRTSTSTCSRAPSSSGPPRSAPAGADAQTLAAAAASLAGARPPAERVAAGPRSAALAALVAAPSRPPATRPRTTASWPSWSTAGARASAPGTSCSRAPPRPRRGRHGTFADVEAPAALRRRRWASTSSTCRRSIRSGARTARAEQRAAGRARRSGQPVGDRRAPRAATRPSTRELGTLDDFDAPRRARRASTGSRSRSTSPSSARPIIRRCSEHPEWFRHRPDGTDPVRREPAQEVPGHLPVRLRDATTGGRCGRSCATSSVFWIEQGVRIFRVDNPHTKPFAFWEWLIARGPARATPTSIFLAEAFTRPEGHVAAGQARLHAVVHLLHLAQHASAELTRVLHRADAAPSRASTSGRTSGRTRRTSCTEYLQHGGRPAFQSRLVLAATLGAELRHLRPGVRAAARTRRASRAARSTSTPRSTRSGTGTSTRPDSLRDADRARQPRSGASNPALQHDCGPALPPTSTTTQLICLQQDDARRRERRARRRQPRPAPRAGGLASTLDLDDARRSTPTQPYQVHDLLGGGALPLARARATTSQLDPHVVPAHVFRVRRRVRTERDFEYFLTTARP